MPRYPSRYSSLSSSSFGLQPALDGAQNPHRPQRRTCSRDDVRAVAAVRLGLVPVWVVRERHVWQLGTYMFIHAGLFHILFNMLALWMFGTELERIWGTRFFLKFYFVTGVGAAVLTSVLAAAFGPLAGALCLRHRRRVGCRSTACCWRTGCISRTGRYYMMLFPIPARLRAHHGRRRVPVVPVGKRRRRERDAPRRPAHRVRLPHQPPKGPRIQLNPWAEVKYRWVKWRLASAQRSSTYIQAAAATVPTLERAVTRSEK